MYWLFYFYIIELTLFALKLCWYNKLVSKLWMKICGRTKDNKAHKMIKILLWIILSTLSTFVWTNLSLRSWINITYIKDITN